MLVFGIFISRAVAQTASPQIYLQCLTNFETYAETLWHPANYSGAPPDAGYWGDGGAQAGNNGGIRGNSGIAVAYAVLVLAQPGNPANSNRLARIRQALNYDAATHFTGGYKSVNGYEWGWGSGTLDTNCSTCTSCSDWQSAEWAGSMGLACLLVESHLPAATVAAVQRVVVSEADHRASVPPCTLILSEGDTKAEENAWDGNILALAAAWMTNNPGASNWLHAAKDYLVNTYTLADPDLITPDTAGDPLSNWISTVTLFPDWSLENHGFYHPTYEMVAGMSSGDSLLMAQLANPAVAAELEPFAEHNVETVWKTNLSLMLLASGDFAYPAGLDWELHDYEQDSYLAWMAAHFNDPLARWADNQMAQLVRYRQIINGNGQFVGPSGGGFYREAVEARRTAIAWLQWAHADFPTGPTNPPAPAIVQFPDTGIIAQRSPWGFVSISYGSRIMGMVEAAPAALPADAYVATPALPGGFGVGPLGNPTAATLLNFTTNAAGFIAQLRVQNGANGQTRVYVDSCGESVAIVEVPLPAPGVNGVIAGCFTNGIENDPLTGGTRRLEWNGGSMIITNRTGVTTNPASSWVCVAGRYGVVAGPDGIFCYRAAAGYNRAGAAQDYLSFLPSTPLGARYCVWFPGKNAAQTAALAGQIFWRTNGSTVVLSFPGNGVTNTLVASLTSSNGVWTADASGNWSDATKWLNGIVADGAGNTADFSTVALSADRTVTLDTSRTIGALKFGGAGGAHNWTLNSGGDSELTLDSGSTTPPTIAVNQNAATIQAPLAGTNGLLKTGPGILILSATNPLSGTVYLDSGSTGGNGDGAVRITTGAALANVTALSLRNNTGSANGSSLQLDGANGRIMLTQNFTNSCRANLIPNVENLDGSNTLAGDILMQTGGSNVVFQSDAGTLALAGNLRYLGTLTAPRWWHFTGSGDFVVSGAILFSPVAPLGVLKSGSGTLRLDGTNTYSNPTVVTAGTLAGTGVLTGPVTILSGATLAPGGNAVGTLTIDNALTNAGTIFIRLGKSSVGLTNDSLAGVSVLHCGGTLDVTNPGPVPLTAGDMFKIFSATNFIGQFLTVNLPPLGTGLRWDTSRLTVDGTLMVALGTVAPRVGQVSLTGTNLVFRGSGGAAGYNFSMLASLDLELPLTNWSLIGIGSFDTNGYFAFTNTMMPGTPRRFFTVRIP